ncbi:histidine phosphatase family protein [Bacillus sp. FJAT-50079]|uniref:histidine phosphatase family protein n=1 Tax=Bacillus sp. FJAT-50079 TaxID=2833577 RepID=UPI001BC91F71|nr:histidine phosphatase family protein [Bacillus sp. FJAT-50079]MBS4209999.1 histidine phosphatase family protein [Bacillus sp. FJAT-50079]
MTKTIYLIRHCEAEGQAPSANLTAKGNEQARQLAGFFSNIQINRIISSPFTRAVDSIHPLANKLSLNIEADDRLCERILSEGDLPDWQLRLEATFQHFQLKYEGGESSEEATHRILNVVNEILENEPTIIVTHGNIMALLIHYYQANFGFAGWKSLTNPDIYLLNIDSQQSKIQRIMPPII